MTDVEFNPGFRFSFLDLVILLAGAGLAGAFALIDPWITTAIGFVVLHFFLFCNIVRMSRSLELIWAAGFLVLAVLVLLDWINWPLALSISGGMSILLVVTELRKPSYHGVGWNVINPRLPAWWEARDGD